MRNTKCLWIVALPLLGVLGCEPTEPASGDFDTHSDAVMDTVSDAEQDLGPETSSNDADDSGDGDHEADGVSLDDVSPIVEFIALQLEIGPQPLWNDGVATCRAIHLSDVLADERFEFHWFFGDGGDLLGEGPTLDLATTHLTPGSRLTCRVTATRGADNATFSAVTTISNRAPTLDAVVLSAMAVATGEQVSCSAQAADPDGGDLEIVYTWHDGSQGAIFDVDADMEPGDVVSCEAEATDALGASVFGISSAIVVNTPPLLNDLTISSQEARVGETLVCDVEVDDPNPGLTTVTWFWSTGTSGPTLLVPQGLVAGASLTCTVVVEDAHGGIAYASATAVFANTAPSVTNVVVSPAVARVGEVVTCAAEVGDRDGPAPHTEYRWSTGDLGPLLRVTSALAPAQRVTCTVTATDASGASASSGAVFAVANTPPNVVSVVSSPLRPRAGELVTCVGVGGDVDRETIEITYGWSDGATGAERIVAPGTSPGTVLICTFTVSDSSGAVATGTATSIIANTPPTLAVTVSPSQARVGDIVTCDAATVDPDPGEVTVRRTWSTGATSLSVVVGRDTPRDRILRCVVVVEDATGAVVSGTGTAVVVNSPPIVGQVQITPQGARRDSILNASAVVTDGDGDALSVVWKWEVNGDEIVGVHDDVLDGTGLLRKGDQVRAVVDVSDGVDTTSTVSPLITILNSAPTAPVGIFEPEIPVAGRDLACVVDSPATDPDEDDISYMFQWSVDGEAFEGATDGAMASVVSGDAVVAGQTWQCVVVATDGEALIQSLEVAHEAISAAPTWTVIWSHALTTIPGGTVLANGAIGGQAIATVQGRSCLKQTSDWNYAYVPVTHAATRWEAIEVEVSFPVLENMYVRLWAFGDKLGGNYVKNSTWFEFLQYNNTKPWRLRGGQTDVATSIATGTFTHTSSAWRKLRMEVDKDEMTVSMYVDGDLWVEDADLTEAGWLTGKSVVLNSNANRCCDVIPNVCWSNLKIYKGER